MSSSNEPTASSEKKRKASSDELSSRRFRHIWQPQGTQQPTDTVHVKGSVYGRAYTFRPVHVFIHEFPVMETCSICFEEDKEKEACVLLKKTKRGMEQACSHKEYSVCRSCMDKTIKAAVNAGVSTKACCPFCREEFSSVAVCRNGPTEQSPKQISIELHAHGSVQTVAQIISTAAAEVVFEVTPAVFYSYTREQKKELRRALLYTGMIALEYDLTNYPPAKSQPISHPVITRERCTLRDKIRRLEEFADKKLNAVPEDLQKIARYLDDGVALVDKHRKRWDKKHYIPFHMLFPQVTKKINALRFTIDHVLSLPLERTCVDLTDD